MKEGINERDLEEWVRNQWAKHVLQGVIKQEQTHPQEEHKAHRTQIIPALPRSCPPACVLPPLLSTCVLSLSNTPSFSARLGRQCVLGY